MKNKYGTPSFLLLFLILNICSLNAQNTKIELVKDLKPGINTGFIQISNNTNGIKVIDNKAFFQGNSDAKIGGELYITDGTDTGTKLVKNIDPRDYRSSLSNFNYHYGSAVHNNQLYFKADSGQGAELWSTNGTDTGTYMVKDIRSSSTRGSNPQNFISFHNRLFFNADTNGSTNRLYYTDGTDTGTKILSQNISQALNPFIFNNHLYYRYITAGISGPPQRMATIDTSFNFTSYSGGSGSAKFSSTTDNNYAIADSFVVYLEKSALNGYELYSIDWNGNQQLLRDINPGTNSGVLQNSRGDNIQSVGNTVFFQGRSTNVSPYQAELWKTNGTSTGTVKVADIGDPTKNTPLIQEMIEFKGKVYFSATNDTDGYELWVSDGTAAGTKMVKNNAIPGNNPWNKGPQNFYIFNHKLYYSAQHPQVGNNKVELWSTDGTSAGTGLVVELDTASTASANPDNFFSLNDKLYFSAYGDTTGYELYTLTEFFNISLGKDTFGCDSIQLKITENAKTYLWNTGDTTPSIHVNKTGTYWLQATDSNRKVGRDTIKINIYTSPKPTISGNLIACGSTTVNADKDYATYLWSTGEKSKSITTDTSIQLLKLTVTNTNGCTGSDYQYVTIDTLPILNLGPDRKACAVSTLSIDPIYKVIWNDNDTMNTKKITLSGIYSAIVENGKGCKTTDSIHVTINPFPTVPFTRDTFACDSLSLTITQSFSKLVWDNGDTNATRTYTQVNQTSASIFIMDSNDCSASSNFYVDIQKTPEFELMDTSICGTDSVLMYSPIPALSSLWSNESRADSIFLNTSGKIWLTLNTTLGCKFTDTALIQLGANPILNLKDTFAGCDSILINAGKFARYLWSDGSTKPSNTFYDLDKTWVNVFDSNECFATDTFVTIINQKPNSNFTILHSTNNTQFIADYPSTIIQYDWRFGDGNNSIQSQPTHTYEFMQAHTVIFMATNECGSDSTIKITTPPYGKTNAIKTPTSQIAIRIFPNPAHQYLQLDAFKKNVAYDVTIFDLNGKIISHANFRNSTQINLTNFAVGMYIIHVSNKQIHQTLKFSKQ